MAEPTPRTLPIGPIPSVAYDAIIEEGWGDSVAQSLNNLSEQVTWMTSPGPDGVGLGGTVPAPDTSVTSTWLLSTHPLYVPDWAAVGFFQIHIAGITEGADGPNTYELQLTVGGLSTAAGISGFMLRLTAPVAADEWFAAIWYQHIDVSTLSGDQEVQILARRVGGDGVWTFNEDGGQLNVIPTYQGAVGWYGE